MIITIDFCLMPSTPFLVVVLMVKLWREKIFVVSSFICFILNLQSQVMKNLLDLYFAAVCQSIRSLLHHLSFSPHLFYHHVNITARSGEWCAAKNFLICLTSLEGHWMRWISMNSLKNLLENEILHSNFSSKLQNSSLDSIKNAYETSFFKLFTCATFRIAKKGFLGIFIIIHHDLSSWNGIFLKNLKLK